MSLPSLAQNPGCSGSIQVSGDVPILPSLRPKSNPKLAPTQTLGLREGRVGISPETWIDPLKWGLNQWMPKADNLGGSGDMLSLGNLGRQRNHFLLLMGFFFFFVGGGGGGDTLNWKRRVKQKKTSLVPLLLLKRGRQMLLKCACDST